MEKTKEGTDAMYNRQLSTFLKVAECRSFTKAAELLFITPSAVVQQINSLENSLQVKLFTRARHGLLLTDAGNYLKQKAPEFISLDDTIRKHLKEMLYNSENLVRVGVSSTHKTYLFFDLWKWFQAENSQYALHVNDLGTYVTDWSNNDIIEGVMTGEFWQREAGFVELFSSPVGCILSPDHPLAAIHRLSYDDLRPNCLISLHPGSNPVLNEMLRSFEDNGLRIQIVDEYDYSLFSRCELGELIIISPHCGINAFPRLKYVECEWPFSIPYGLFFRQKPGKAVMEFLNMVRDFKERNLINFEELYIANCLPFGES